MAVPLLHVVAGDQALAEFRQGLTGERAFELLRQASGQLLVQLAVGVGKTEWLVSIILHALITTKSYDLVVVLLPLWQILDEVRQRLSPDLSPTILYPRPRQRCGDLDTGWLEYEQTSCGSLGRKALCMACPKRRGCTWPGQYSRLQGVRLILATQQHLVSNPHFIRQVRQQVQARRVLTLLDESDLLLRNGERTIRRQELEQFMAAQQVVLLDQSKPTTGEQQWLELSRLVAMARPVDLREGRWQFPWVDADWAIKVQQAGRDKFGPGFRFLGYELHHFADSDYAGRERLPSGDLRFAVPPYLGKEFIIFSGSIARDLARYRLDPNFNRPALSSPFEHYRFEHPNTRWYNIASLIGAAKFFPRNAGAILDFFATKIANNIREGKRTLLVARKKFRSLIQRGLRDRLSKLDLVGVKIITCKWQKHNVQDPRTLPLISYGISGINLFQHCEAAYCLTSYYADATTIAESVHDIDSTSERYHITIRCAGNPPQRRVGVEAPNTSTTILPRIAQGVLDQKESDVVVQAVGRVRPFTRAREVITFQAGRLPGVRYTAQFGCLAQARDFFGIPTTRSANLAARAEKACQLKKEGKTRREIAAAMNVSVSTVKRYLRRGGGVTKPSVNSRKVS